MPGCRGEIFCLQIHSIQWLYKPYPVSIYLCSLTPREPVFTITMDKWHKRKNEWPGAIGSEFRCDLCDEFVSSSLLFYTKARFSCIAFYEKRSWTKNKSWNFLKLFREDILVLLKFKITPLSFQTLAFHVICSREVYC